MKIIKRDRPWSYYVEKAMANASPLHLTAGMAADAANKLVGYPYGHIERLTHGNANSLLSDMAKQGRVRRLKEKGRNITNQPAKLWALAKPSRADKLEAKEIQLRIRFAHAINKLKAGAAKIALLGRCLAIAESSGGE